MLYPIGMQKIRLYAVKSIGEQVIKDLHNLGMVEISSAEHKGLQCGSPLESFNRVSAQLVRMRAIRSGLPKREGTHADFQDPLTEAEAVTIDSEMKGLYEELSRLDSEIKKMAEELKITRQLHAFKDIDFMKLNTRTITYVAGVVPRESIPKITRELEESKVRHKLRWAAEKKEAFIVVIFERGLVDVERLLTNAGFRKLEVPQELTSPEKYIFWLERETKIKQKRKEEIRSRIASIADSNYAKIATLERQLSSLADESEIAANFCASKSVYIIEGWMQKQDVHKLENELKRYDGKVYIEKAKTTEHELAPTVLGGAGVAKPYRYITKTYSLPNASEVDPTMFYFVMIPILYGMIVGDVIYGILSFFIAYFLLKKFAKSEIMSNVSKIWLYSAIPAIIFGVLFDEYAGMSHFHLLEKISSWGAINLPAMGITGPLYAGMSRLHNLTLLFQILLYLGMAHLALGFLLGAVNEWGHNKKHAIGKLAWIGVEIGGFLVVTVYLFNMFDPGAGSFGLGLLLLSTVVIALTEGITGILEIPGITGNVFSYLRIGVVGVVGTILAEIINQVLMPMPGQGLVALLLIIPLFALLHVFNAFIAMFEAMIQGGRLNIIEFKMKFMKGGGRLFKPFAIDKIL